MSRRPPSARDPQMAFLRSLPAIGRVVPGHLQSRAASPLPRPLPTRQAIPTGGTSGAPSFTLDYFLINGRAAITSSSTGHVDMSIDWSERVVEAGTEITYPGSPSWADISTTDISRPWRIYPGAYLLTLVASVNLANIGPVEVSVGSNLSPLDIPSDSSNWCNLVPGVNSAAGNLTIPLLVTPTNNPFGSDLGIFYRTGVLTNETRNVNVEATIWRFGDAA